MTATQTTTTDSAPAYGIRYFYLTYGSRDEITGCRSHVVEYHGTLAGCRVALTRLGRGLEHDWECRYEAFDLATGRTVDPFPPTQVAPASTGDDLPF